MAECRGPTAEEWQAHRDCITRLYANEGRSLKDVVEYMAGKQFFASERQYKTRIASWGLKKKITRREYMAMFEVLQSRLPETTIFEVPRVCGTKKENKTLIDKELSRRIQRQPPPLTLAEAYGVLSKANIAIVQATGSASSVPACPGDAEVLQCDCYEQIGQGHHHATIPNRRLPNYSQPEHLDNTVRFRPVNYPSHVPRYSLGAPSTFMQHDRLRQPDEFNDILGNMLFPPTTSSHSSSLRPKNLVPSHDSSLQDAEYKERIAIGVTAYYTQQCLTGYDTLDAEDHFQRRSATAGLTQMFQDRHEHVLSVIHTTAYVFYSHRHLVQLQAFLQDCATCMLKGDPDGPFRMQLEFLSATFSSAIVDYQKFHNMAVTAFPMVEHRSSATGCVTEWDSVIENVETLFGARSTAYLITKFYDALQSLHRMDISDFDETQSKLDDVHDLCVGIMGTEHPLRANILAMVASLYEKMLDQEPLQGNHEIAQQLLSKAVRSIEYALAMTDKIPHPFRAFHLEPHRRLVEINLRGGSQHLEKAWRHSQVVLDYCLSRFGLNPPITRNAIMDCYRILKRQGRPGDAESFYKQLLEGEATRNALSSPSHTRETEISRTRDLSWRQIVGIPSTKPIAKAPEIRDWESPRL